MSKLWIPISLALLSILFIFGFVTIRETLTTTKQSVDSLHGAVSEQPATIVEPIVFYNFNPTTPLEFCGEPVPLGDVEVFERFERDFLINTNDRTQMTMYLKRASRFFPYIEKRLAQAGLPDDFKYLAVAESGLLDLRSPAGASGIWQIMPETGKQLGLTVNSVVDERYNLERATDVAMRYLTNSYQRFGNWAMVAASYNMGGGGASDEQNFQDAKNYYALWFNRETARYVFRILAIKEVMKNPVKYGYARVVGYKPIETKEVVVRKSIPNLAEWAKEQSTSFKAVKYLNPWMRARDLPMPPAAGYKILLPKNGGDFIAMDTIAYSYPLSVQQDVAQGFHSVLEGETMESIANRCGLTAIEIRKINKLQDGEEIKPGQKLRIVP
jgi:membrane-bound lytic murein transglycosylase D